MVYQVLVKEPRVVRESGQLCYWIVQQDETKRLTTDLMSKVHLRKDVMDVMLWQLKSGCFDAVNTNEIRTTMFNSGLQAVKAESVLNSAK